MRHVPLDVVRWKLLSIELQPDDDLDALLAKTRRALDAARAEADGRLLAVRLIVAGACAAHLSVISHRDKVESELRALTFEWRDEVWLEEIRLHTRPPLALDELRASEGFVGELLRAPPEGLPAALKPLADRPELKEAGLDLGDEALLRELTADAEALLATRLTR